MTTRTRPACPFPHVGGANAHASHARLRKPFGPSNASALRGLSRSPRRRIRRRYGARVACHFDMSLVALRPRSTAGPLGQVGEQSLAQFSGVGAWLSRGTPAIQATGGLQ